MAAIRRKDVQGIADKYISNPNPKKEEAPLDEVFELYLDYTKLNAKKLNKIVTNGEQEDSREETRGTKE